MGVQLSAQGAIIKTAYEAEADAYTDAKNTKLAGIEALADVTDATNVATAGAVMDSDISEAEGFLRKTGAGAYEAIKTNMNAAVAPTANEDSGDGYAVGSRWLDTTADKEYVCLNATVGAAVWIETTVTTWAGLTDTYGSITANKLVIGNSGGNALEFSAANEADYFLRTGARAMSSDLDTGIHYVFGAGLRGYSDSVFTTFAGGPGSADSSRMIIHGKDSAGNGRVSFAILDAAETGTTIAMQMEGGSDTPIVDINYGLDMNAKNIDDIGGLILNDATELTIATGAVTATQSYHSIDTEADAATDDLDTISGGTAGQILTIRAINSARTVVAKDGTGNLQLTADMTLDNAQDTLTLIYDGTNWLETGRANNGA